MLKTIIVARSLGTMWWNAGFRHQYITIMYHGKLIKIKSKKGGDVHLLKDYIYNIQKIDNIMLW